MNFNNVVYEHQGMVRSAGRELEEVVIQVTITSRVLRNTQGATHIREKKMKECTTYVATYGTSHSAVELRLLK